MSTKLTWEVIEENGYGGSDLKNFNRSYTARAKVYKGWLVKTGVFSRQEIVSNGPDLEFALGLTNGVGITFVPDENWEWVL